MTASTAVLIIERIVAFALFWQGLEILSLARSSAVLKIWSFEHLRPQLEAGLPLPPRVIAAVLGDSSLQLIALVQVAAALGGFFSPSLLWILVLFFTHLLICVRFRGVFSGGSDIVTFVVMTGLFITALPFEKARALGLCYIAIHVLYSYFRAGHAKVVRQEWRSGEALPAFFERSVYLDVRRLGSWLRSRRGLCVLACWGVIAFELAAFVVPFVRGGIEFYFVLALGFHLVVFFTFGLNRFFWSWLSAWPAILYAVSFLRTGL